MLNSLGLQKKDSPFSALVLGVLEKGLAHVLCEQGICKAHKNTAPTISNNVGTLII